jgi:F0F1-type ATP synthase delta subunit
LASIAKLSDRKSAIEKHIDPSYYWSFILRIGDKYNASVANRLQVLKELSN